MTSAPAVGKPWLVLTALVIGQLITLLDTTIVNVAVPALTSDLDASIGSVLWTINAYVLAYAVLLISGGRLGDLYGPRRMFLVGVAVFAAASLFCGIAGSPEMLIAARVAQGVGAALLTPQTLSMITMVFPQETRGAAFGVWGAVNGLGAALGPTLGGFLVDVAGWRWVFLINLPIGAAAIVMALAWIPKDEGGTRRRFDVLGTVIVTSGMLLLTYSLIEGENHGWGEVWGPVTVPMLVAAGLLALVAFALVERGRQAREPLLPFAVIRDRNFTLMAVVVAALPLGLGSMLFLTLLHLQSVLGMGALQAGLVIAIAPLLSAFIAPRAGKVIDQRGGRPVLMVGLALFMVGVGAIALGISGHGSWWHLVPGLLVLGLGMGVAAAPAAIIAMRDIPQSIAGAASGVFNTTRLLGSLLGSAAVGALLQIRMTDLGIDDSVLSGDVVPTAARDATAAALQFAFLLPVAALLAGVLLTAAVRKPVPAPA